MGLRMGAGEVGRAWGQGKALGGIPGVRPLRGNWRGIVWGKACRERHEFPDLSEL